MVNKLITNFDNWSDDVIKNSIFGKFFKLFKGRFSSRGEPMARLFSQILIFSICILFVSLLLPQFAGDRFGIGIIILICFFFFLINLFLNKIKFTFNSIDFLIIIFLLISLISSFSSYFFKESLIGLLKYILFFLSYLILKVVSQNISKNSFLFLWSFLFFCAVSIAGIGIHQYIVGVEPLANWEDPTVEDIHTRVYSTLGNPNLLAGYLLLFLPFGLIIPFETQSNFLTRLFYLIGSIMIFFCLIFTGSRGGYIGLIAGILALAFILLSYLLKNTRNKITSTLIFTIVISMIIIAIFFLFPVIKERLLTIFTLREHSSNNFRVNVWLACLKLVKDNFLIGVGAGNNTFRLAYGLYMKSGFDALAAYNIFLEVLIELGILGFFTFILALFLSFVKLHYLFWERNNLLSIGIFISIISLIIQGMVDTVLFRPQIFIPFFFLLASIGKLEIEEKD